MADVVSRSRSHTGRLLQRLHRAERDQNLLESLRTLFLTVERLATKDGVILPDLTCALVIEYALERLEPPLALVSVPNSIYTFSYSIEQWIDLLELPLVLLTKVEDEMQLTEEVGQRYHQIDTANARKRAALPHLCAPDMRSMLLSLLR